VHECSWRSEGRVPDVDEPASSAAYVEIGISPSSAGEQLRRSRVRVLAVD
jgi:hypothetical protein